MLTSNPEIAPVYCLSLDDFAVPAFCSFEKCYFGSISQITSLFDAMEADENDRIAYEEFIQAFREYCKGNTEATHHVAYREIPLLEPVSVYAKTKNAMDRDKVEHLNVWGCIYYMRWKKAETAHIWLRCKDSYVRCMKARFYDLQFAVMDAEENYKPIDYYMGFPKQTVFGEDADEHTVENRLYVIEKSFESEQELLNDIRAFKNAPDPVYTEFFNDIFADG